MNRVGKYLTGNPRILEVLVALVMRLPHSSGFGMTNSRTEEKSNKTWALPIPCPDVERIIPCDILGTSAFDVGAGSSVRVGKAFKAVAMTPSGTW